MECAASSSDNPAGSRAHVRISGRIAPIGILILLKLRSERLAYRTRRSEPIRLFSLCPLDCGVLGRLSTRLPSCFDIAGCNAALDRRCAWADTQKGCLCFGVVCVFFRPLQYLYWGFLHTANP